VYPDPAAVATATAARLLTTVIDTLAVRDQAHIVLTGGTVGIATLAAAAESNLRDLVNWTDVHVWWGDERFVPSGHPDRNEGQAQAALLSSLPLPEENIHRMGSSDAFDQTSDAAAAYADELGRFGTGCPEFDVLLLGLGPDGHVASLFPDHSGLDDADSWALAVHDSPKPPPTRVSLGTRAIARAREVWVVAAGVEKAEAVASCLHEPLLPGGRVRGTERTLWLI